MGQGKNDLCDGRRQILPLMLINRLFNNFSQRNLRAKSSVQPTGGGGGWLEASGHLSRFPGNRDCASRVGRPISASSLNRDGFPAAYLGTGQNISWMMKLVMMMKRRKRLP